MYTQLTEEGTNGFSRISKRGIETNRIAIANVGKLVAHEWSLAKKLGDLGLGRLESAAAIRSVDTARSFVTGQPDYLCALSATILEETKNFIGGLDDLREEFAQERKRAKQRPAKARAKKAD